jgi:hypothetical protein
MMIEAGAGEPPSKRFIEAGGPHPIEDAGPGPFTWNRIAKRGTCPACSEELVPFEHLAVRKCSNAACGFWLADNTPETPTATLPAAGYGFGDYYHGGPF